MGPCRARLSHGSTRPRRSATSHPVQCESPPLRNRVTTSRPCNGRRSLHRIVRMPRDDLCSLFAYGIDVRALRSHAWRRWRDFQRGVAVQGLRKLSQSTLRIWPSGSARVGALGTTLELALDACCNGGPAAAAVPHARGCYGHCLGRKWPRRCQRVEDAFESRATSHVAGTRVARTHATPVRGAILLYHRLRDRLAPVRGVATSAMPLRLHGAPSNVPYASTPQRLCSGCLRNAFANFMPRAETAMTSSLLSRFPRNALAFQVQPAGLLTP